MSKRQLEKREKKLMSYTNDLLQMLLSQRALGVILLASCFVPSALGQTTEPRVLARAHAHNDYLHPRPLLDALDQGFASVEADIFLVKGELLVAHSFLELNRERTLEELYLKPLAARCASHGGRVYRDGPELLLLIDLKSEAQATYQALIEALKPYSNLLTRWQEGREIAGAIRVVISGNRPVEVMAQETSRLAFLDGRTIDLETKPPVELVPLVSDQWSKHFKWNGRGTMPAEEQQRLKELVALAHAQHRQLRFWGVPDKPAVWQELLDAQVDLINTDKLAELAKFLNSSSSPFAPRK